MNLYSSDNDSSTIMIRDKKETKENKNKKKKTTCRDKNIKNMQAIYTTFV